MMKLKIKYLMIALIFLSTIIPTFASNKGSITISLEEACIYTYVEDVEFKIYKIGDVKDGLYVIDDQYSLLSIDLNDLDTSEKLDEASDLLASHVLDNKLGELYVTKTNDKGICVFTDLDVAIYLIVASDTTNYDDIKPTIIAIPTFNETTKQMNYDVEVYPKHSPSLVTIELLKLDADDKSTPLKDAVFTLYDHEQNELQTTITNTNGIATFEYVPFGDYTIKETTAPNGYKLSEEEITLTVNGKIKEKRVVHLEVFNEQLPSYQTGDTEPVNAYLITSILSFWVLLIIFCSRSKQTPKGPNS